MIDKFCTMFEGEFNNQRQAFQNPTRFAMIEVIHERIEENKFSIRQQYMVDHQPYRSSIIEVVQIDDFNLVLKNYRSEDLQYQPGCDIMAQYRPEPDEFFGGSMGNGCMVPWREGDQFIETYLSTQFILTLDLYQVVDRGISSEGRQVWGSEHGFFEFRKQYPDQFKTPL
jgi:hypothetical protein